LLDEGSANAGGGAGDEPDERSHCCWCWRLVVLGVK
jgi:hypothetical protein